LDEPGKQIKFSTNIGRVWAEQVHAREVNLLCHTCSIDEVGLEHSQFPAKLPNQRPEKVVTTVSPVYPVSSVTYWESPEARKLFGASDGDEDALVTINQKIEKLRAVNQKLDGYCNVVEGRDPHNKCMQFQNFELWQCCALLCMAYVNARGKMNAMTWMNFVVWPASI